VSGPTNGTSEGGGANATTVSVVSNGPKVSGVTDATNGTSVSAEANATTAPGNTNVTNKADKGNKYIIVHAFNYCPMDGFLIYICLVLI
jgi:hypothetical protein